MNKKVGDTGCNDGGWGASELRANMNPEIDIVSNGVDENLIWDLVPTDLQDSIVAVQKAYQPTYNDNPAIAISNDRLFIASYSEHVETSHWGASHWSAQEGSQYAYWYNKVTKNYGANDLLIKDYQNNTSTDTRWWERSVSPNNSTNFLVVYTNGGPSSGATASASLGVCPCFCL